MRNENRSKIIMGILMLLIAMALVIKIVVNFYGFYKENRELKNKWDNTVVYPQELKTVVVPENYTGTLIVKGMLDVEGVSDIEGLQEPRAYVNRNYYTFNIEMSKNGEEEGWELVNSEEARAEKISIKGIDITEIVEDVVGISAVSYNYTEENIQEETRYISLPTSAVISIDYKDGEIQTIEKAVLREGWENFKVGYNLERELRAAIVDLMLRVIVLLGIEIAVYYLIIGLNKFAKVHDQMNNYYD